MGEEAQSLRADIDKTTSKIEQLEAQLEALPSDATASDSEYLQQTILALGREKELLLQLLLQRLPPAQGAGDAQALTKYSRNSVAFSKPSGLRAAATLCMLFWTQPSWAWWLLMVFLLPVQFGQCTVASIGSSTG